VVNFVPDCFSFLSRNSMSLRGTALFMCLTYFLPTRGP
jgi:hypothetical protein